MKAILFKIPKNDEGSIKLEEDKEPYFYGFLHYHPEIQITLILKGEGEFIIGGKRGRFKPGNLFIIGQNDPHVFLSDKIYYENNNKISHSISVFFNQYIFDRLFYDFKELQILGKFSVDFSKGIIIESTMGEIQFTFRKMFTASPLTKFQLFILLLELLNEHREKRMLNPNAEIIKSSETGDKKLSAVYEYILENFNENPSLDEAAKTAHMSTPSFCRYIKKRTRKTFTGLVNDLRIGEAQKLLSRNDRTISEIGFEVGFNNLTNFNRKFKKITGKTPGEYRAS
ncbi:MAG: AraC family transcriptional regulator [Bacteroidetes bacterium HGW-Bacteroidetes-17]|jgi:AraC-like DNA-binding protein|nr:MAG: AraC family transcriptional regulator [Bacteroidetes bacterium HGW-Bacteroidetes-17]